MVKTLPANAGDSRDASSIPGSGRFHRADNGNPLQYSHLGNSMDTGAWQATVYGVVKSDRLTECNPKSLLTECTRTPVLT